MWKEGKNSKSTHKVPVQLDPIVLFEKIIIHTCKIIHVGINAYIYHMFYKLDRGWIKVCIKTSMFYLQIHVYSSSPKNVTLTTHIYYIIECYICYKLWWMPHRNTNILDYPMLNCTHCNLTRRITTKDYM